MMDKDEFFIQKAMQLALKAKGQTSPNPLVGALVVKNNRIIGRGYHQRAGGPHAEIFALRQAGKKAKGTKLYVTLEPCAHYGRTPPCVDKILKSGVKEVIIGMKDPNPLNNGKGMRILRQHKIKVKVGFLEEDLKKINTAFIKYITKKVPFITVKVGQSLDGKIATRTGDSQWITSTKSRVCAHNLRKNYDAIIMGANTIIKDNPLLNPKAYPKGKKFFKIIVDTKLKIPLNSRIFSKNSRGQVLIATSKNISENKLKIFQDKGAEIISFATKKGKIILKDLMRKLAKQEITNILVEGGGNLIGSLFDEKVVDKIIFFIAPKIIGGKEAVSSVEGKGISTINRIIKLKDTSFKKIGEDFLIEGEVK